MLSAKLKEAAGNSADATLYVDDVFSTWLYTGNGSTQTITNGIDLAGKGGLVWVKSRSAATNNFLFDTTRGVNVEINSNTTDANATLVNSVTAFNSSGFALGSAAGINVSAATYASWTFRKAAKFFDVVTYTGTGTNNLTIAHNLGVAAGFIIVKATDSNGDWAIWQVSAGAAQGYLNSAAALTGVVQNFPNEQSSTTSFSVYGPAYGSILNNSGTTYVAYLFAHDTSSTGIIQCGSFTSTGSTDTVTLGWEPQLVLLKNANGIGGYDWEIYDTMRGATANNTAAKLLPNSNAAEVTQTSRLAPTATGFTYKNGINGNTYIYMAILRPNKPPTTGTQVYLPSIAASGYVTTGFTVDALLQGIRAGAGGFPAMMDRLRGVSTTPTAASTLTVTTSSSAAETNTNASSQGWDNTGFTALQAGAVNWTFKRAPGFFDEVCYTGTGVAGSTQAHNLTVVPELMIVKCRSNASSSWRVLYQPTGIVGQLESTVALVTTNREFYFGDDTNYIAPTSTVFTVASNSSVNTSARTYVAYLFATLAGISKVGSYTGNGGTQAINCGFTAGARFVLIKRTDSAGGWYTFDSARGLTSGSSPYLLLNSTAAEVTGNNGVYASTGGFTLDSTASTTTNINAATYIFLAVA